MNTLFLEEKKGNGYNWSAGMSVNACNAYDNGEMPSSKVAKLLGCTTDDVRMFKHSSWHHTSKMFNRTYFYDVYEMFESNPNLFVKIAKGKKGKALAKELVRRRMFDRLQPVQPRNYNYSRRFKELSEKYKHIPTRSYYAGGDMLADYIDRNGKMNLSESNFRKILAGILLKKRAEKKQSEMRKNKANETLERLSTYGITQEEKNQLMKNSSLAGFVYQITPGQPVTGNWAEKIAWA